MIDIQTQLAERCLQLLALPEDTQVPARACCNFFPSDLSS